MAIVSESLRTTLDHVRKGLAGLEQRVAVLERKALKSLESNRVRLNRIYSQFDGVPGQLSEALARVSNRVRSVLVFATKEDVRGLFTKVAELEGRLDRALPAASGRKTRVVKA
jgi:BMFP domain-containing protein YqiC